MDSSTSSDRRAIAVLLGPRAAGKTSFAVAAGGGRPCVAADAVPSCVGLTPEDFGCRIMDDVRVKLHDAASGASATLDVVDPVAAFGIQGLVRSAHLILVCIPFGTFASDVQAETERLTEQLTSVKAPVALIGTRCDLRDERESEYQERAAREAAKLKQRRESGPQYDAQHQDSDPVFDQGIDGLIAAAERAASGSSGSRRWMRDDMVSLAAKLGACAFVECSAKSGAGLGSSNNVLLEVVKAAKILPSVEKRKKCIVS